MNRRRRRPNYFSWTVLGLVLLFGYYFNQIYLPAQPNPFEATPTVTRSPESYATEAREFFENGKLEDAIEAYEQAIKASPQDPTLYIELARVQVFAGQPEEAQANAENALLLNPSNSMAHAVKAWALDFQGGAENNADAMGSIQRAIELDPNNAVAHAYYAEILVDSGSFENYAKAAEESRIALALDPNALETRRARAYILEATGSEGNNYELALQQYQAAIEVHPNLPILHIELGRTYRVLQVYDKAIEEFTRADTLNPPDPAPDLLISRTYATIGEFAKALQYAETAVENEPQDASLHGNYGVMLYRNLLWAEAVTELRLAIKGGTAENGFEITGIPLVNEPRVAEYYFTYGLALARTNECGEALQITQLLQSRVSSDENAMFAAEETVRICQENLDNPAAETPTPGDVEETPEVETPTETPEPTATSMSEQ
ncbi:MAG TPA: tetratricopeptide repeat protein [Anaerolineales bacterium]|nr:tetratricopeptide repeat protein [Anaerolineales bacterium]